RIQTVLRDATPGVPNAARLSVRNVPGEERTTGHPLIPDEGQPRFDGQNGDVFFYSEGFVELEVPAGPVHIRAVQGLSTPNVDRLVEVEPGETRDIVMELSPLWDAEEGGWLSGEHHFHLNYGGPFQLVPDDLRVQMAGEAMDVATPLVANLHHRFGERELWGWSSLASPPFIAFGQEIRSHFLGHLGLIGIDDLFWPWIWGPGYQVYRTDDRPNAEALRFGRSQNGIGSYVHPVTGRDPFEEGNAGMIPVGFIPDAVLGDLDALEVVCLWSDELGTAELWYRVLNLGIPLVATAGSDVMTDFYRTMAIGSTRVFVQVGEDRSWTTYLNGLREGRSFVTTGPYLDFHLVGEGGGVVRPGEALAASGEGAESRPDEGDRQAGAAGRIVEWRIDLRSPTAVERVEILVNGEVVHTEEGPAQAGAREYEGRIEIPEGGWVAARAWGGEVEWPLMDSYPFAHSGAVWIGTRGSVDPVAADRAARELLAALEVAEARLRAGYEGVDIP
ncbi:MAG: CehA/McbA family metallohydrolase, partial [Gemmatimonadota bacterium]